METALNKYLRSKGIRPDGPEALDRINTLYGPISIAELLRGYVEFINRTPDTDPRAREAIFTGYSQLILDVKPGTPPALKEFNFGLEVNIPGPLQERDYKTSSGIHTGQGVKMLTNCLVQGLAGNIKAAAAADKWRKEDHIKFITKELARALVNQDVVILPDEIHYRGVLK